MISKTANTISRHGLLYDGGKMGEQIRSYDWTKTSLGPIEGWPQSLIHSLNIILRSPVPMVMLWGADGVMLYNDAYAVLAGTKRPFRLGLNVVDGWPEVADFNKNVMKKGMRGETLSYRDQELTLYRGKSPETVWMDLNYSPIVDENGQYVGVLAIVIETTDRVKSDIKQKLATQQVTDVLESMGDAVFMLDKEWNIISVNKVHEKATHTKREEILGKFFWDVFPADPESKYWVEHHKVMKTRKPSHFDEYYEPLDLWTETDVYPTRNGGIAVFFRDITARRRAETKLRTQLQITETITNNATACLFVINTEGIVTYLNPAAMETTGYTVKEALGKPMHTLVHHSYPDGRPYPNAKCPLVDTYKNGKRSPIHEDTFFRKDGSPFPVLVSGVPVGGISDARSTIVEFRDITEEKGALQEQERLILMTHQRNELIKLNGAKDEFIALASHQLRTPATAVKQYISLVLDGYSGPVVENQKKYLQTAYDSNERQLKVIDDLLKTAQIDSNRFVLHKHRVPVWAILREVVDDLASVLELKNQHLKVEGMEITDKVYIDENEMKLVFINLLENASKYSYPDSKIKIAVSKKNKYLEIDISDEGVGIGEDDVDKIFEKFTRINNDLSDTVTGSGIGLYWVKRIIKLHDGKLKVKSVLGQGSHFIVSLPL